MRSKFQWASAVALVATVFTALFTAQGSGAAASDLIPTLTTQVAKEKPTTEFVSQPIVQTVPSQEAEPVAKDVEFDADSLPELVAQQDVPENLSREMRCLAGAIYFESRGESLAGQLAVGHVVVNRAKSGRFPSSYCGVVFQPSQFSFVRGGSMPSIRENSESWRDAIAIAQIASEGSWHSKAKGALFFHATHVSPNWRLTRLARVDNHIFYR